MSIFGSSGRRTLCRGFIIGKVDATFCGMRFSSTCLASRAWFMACGLGLRSMLDGDSIPFCVLLVRDVLYPSISTNRWMWGNIWNTHDSKRRWTDNIGLSVLLTISIVGRTQ
jgi:hypothetical protein